MTETLTIEIDLDAPAATTLDALNEELGEEDVDAGLGNIAENAVTRRIHELWMNKDKVQKNPAFEQ